MGARKSRLDSHVGLYFVLFYLVFFRELTFDLKR